MSHNTACETAAYGQKRLLTRLFLADCLCILRSLYDFVFINGEFRVLFQSSSDVFRSVATETGDPVDTTQQVARTQWTQTLCGPRRYFSPALSASTHSAACRPPMMLCLAGPAVIVELVADVAVTRQSFVGGLYC